MRRQLKAWACLGSLAALTFPAPAAQAATSAQACQVAAARPTVSHGFVRGTATRSGCSDKALLRVRIAMAVSGPDRVVKSGSRTVRTGSVTAQVRCTTTPRTYYVIALDAKGRTGKSRTARLACGKFASADEEALVKLTNKARAGNDCKPLTHDPRLHLAADRHSADMADKGRLKHTSDGRTFAERIKAVGFPYSLIAENVAMGYPAAATVLKDWLKSPGHRKNILNCSFTHIGVGYSATRQAWTQIFAAR
ncbi:CAP domain-containing protein [Nonomuraea deserti]|uniref:CAP domain-containing protein n=1 Tax=Nonomuraea deserti TaxID=1848322 RepID=A0A4R4VP82_9ACTN|nr:CAP domain-containing protein [Nonomuraea deserti]TDD07698.1 CAP domain-containing protein [Nonomuraea deserti]